MKICPTCRRTHPDDIAFCPHDATPLLPADAASPIGQALDGRYEIELLLADTPGGRLYRVRDVLLGDRMALKIFNPELSRDVPGWLQHLQRNRRAAHAFRHPNVVTIYDITDDYLVMEYVEGETLDKALRVRERFTPRDAAEVLARVADALDSALRLSVECEFLTPSDIMLTRAKGGLPHVKLLPLIFNRRFGESNSGDAPIGETLKLTAFAPYLAPELWSGVTQPVDYGRALVYSVGVIAYELMSGRKPFDAETAYENALRQTAAQPKPLTDIAPDIPAAVSAIVERALNKTLNKRPATVTEFVSELQGALDIEKRWPETVTTDRVTRGVGTGQSESLESASSSAETLSYAPAEAAGADEPVQLDENVQFTVYQPETIAPARWYTLLALAHLSKRRPDAPPDEPDPAAEVKRIAARVLADEPVEYDSVKQNSFHAVPRAGEITFVPEMEGCEFNPPRQSFSWQKSVHKVEFEMRASRSLEGRTARGRLTVFLGTLILADVPLAIGVDSGAGRSSTRETPQRVAASAAPYRKIFPSYSHRDRAVVEQIEQHVHALGDTYLRDVTQLRAGQDWQRWMRDAIREADVFQLFWSHNSMRSNYVREEWEYALSLGRPNFIRPTYWEFPLPESPAENLPPDELRRLHFQYLQGGTMMTHPSMPDSSAEGAQAKTEQQAQASGSIGAQPTEAVVLCSMCGARFSTANTFCGRCGAALKARASSHAQTAATPAPESNNAPDVFRDKQLREPLAVELREMKLATSSPASYQASTQQPPPARAKGRPFLWISLLLVLLFFAALAVGLLLLFLLR